MTESRKSLNGEDSRRSENQKRSDDLRRANFKSFAKGEERCAARLGLTREQYLERWRRLLGSQDPSVYTMQFKGSDRSPDDSKKT